MATRRDRDCSAETLDWLRRNQPRGYNPRSRVLQQQRQQVPQVLMEQWSILLQCRTQSTQTRFLTVQDCCSGRDSLNMMLDNFGHQHWSMGDRTPMWKSSRKRPWVSSQISFSINASYETEVPEAIHVSTAPSALISNFGWS